MQDTALEFGPPSGTGKLIPLLLDAGTSSCTRLPPPTDGIFPHLAHSHACVTAQCDQWASADAGIFRQDSPRASWPQAILKLCPPSSLDYKARHGPQTYCVSMRPKLKKIPNLILPEYLIFPFSYKTPYLGQKGPPCPTWGVRGGNLTTDWFIFHRAFI